MHLPDELQHIEERLNSKFNKTKKAVIVLAVICIIFLAATIALFVNHTTSDLQAENASLKTENQAFLHDNSIIKAEILQIDAQIRGLEANISSLQISINTTNQQINDLQSYVGQNCDIMHQDLKFNKTNMNALVISIQSSSSSNVPALSSLNLSGNSLNKFCDNSLPDVANLDLTNNPIANISNNKLWKVADFRINRGGTLKEFSKNTLPLVKNLDFSSNGMSVFKDNVLSGVQSLNLDDNNLSILSDCIFEDLSMLSFAKNPMKELANNRFPKLSEISDLRGLAVMNGNYFGLLQNLEFVYPESSLIFEQNTLPSVGTLSMRYLQYDFLKLKTNSLPLLRTLVFEDCHINNFQYLQQLRLLAEIRIILVSQIKFIDHEYPNLKRLTIQRSDLVQFSNNKLPSLQWLSIQESNITDICNGNLMLNLKEINIFNMKQLASIPCLSKLQSLENLVLLRTGLTTFDNYAFPLLQQLQLDGTDYLSSFRNNKLPKLKQLHITINATLDLHAVEQSLQYLNINCADNLSLTSHTFDNLLGLSLSNYMSTTVRGFTDCKFPQLTRLHLQYVQSSIGTANSYGALRQIDILFCHESALPQANYDDTIQTISIGYTKMDKFSNRNMQYLKEIKLISNQLSQFNNNSLPMATTIYIIYNQITTLDCSGFGAVRILRLSSNHLTGQVAERLIACNLANLQQLDLSFNDISNTNYVTALLKQKYPGITLTI